MAEQLALDLPCKTAFGAEDYFVSEANALAAGLVENWRDWPEKRLLVIGPKGAGKTHLARIWCDQVQGRVLDLAEFASISPAIADQPAILENLESLPRELEEALFHVLNIFIEAGQYILLTGRGSISSWGIHLPDLESRLRQFTQGEIHEPDDNLLLAVLIKLFQDRGLSPNPNVIEYIKKRMPRSFEGLAELVAELDQRSLKSGGGVTLKLARTLFEEL